jgi:hypothetical protein
MGADPFLQLVRLVLTTQGTEIGDEVAGRGQGAGVVIAQYPAAAGEGVLLELASLFVVAQRMQVEGRGSWPSSGCGGGRRPVPGGG